MNGQSYESMTSPDEEILQSEVDMILNNYRCTVERNGRRFYGHGSLGDIVKAFVLYGFDDDLRRVTLMDPDSAHSKLNKIMDGRAKVGPFEDWRSASAIVQGLLLVPSRISAEILVESFMKLLRSVKSTPEGQLVNMPLIGSDACNLIDSMCTGDAVSMPVFLSDLAHHLRHIRLLTSPEDPNDIESCLMLLMGTESDEGTAGDVVLFVANDSTMDQPSKVLETFRSIPEGGHMVLVTHPGFVSSGTKDFEECRRLLSEYRMDSINRIATLVMELPQVYIIDIHKKRAGRRTLVRSFEPFSIGRSDERFVITPSSMTEAALKDDWSVEAYLEPEGKLEVPTVSLGKIGSVRRGVIIPKTECVDGIRSDLPIYLRPVDIKDGEIDLEDIRSVTRFGVRPVEPGSILVSTQGRVGTTYLVRDEDPPCVASSRFITILPSEGYTPEYIETFFRSSYFIDRALEISKDDEYVSTEDMKSIGIPVADKEQQDRIVRLFRELDDPSPAKVSLLFDQVLGG